MGEKKPLFPGEKYGHLTVVGKDEARSSEKGHHYYFFQCDCGSPIKSIRKDTLFNKYYPVVSCGCQVSEKRPEKQYDIESQTSFPEQGIFFYMNKRYVTENRYLFHNHEIDVFIPSLSVGIEYDGEYYHSSKQSIMRAEKKTYI